MNYLPMDIRIAHAARIVDAIGIKYDHMMTHATDVSQAILLEAAERDVRATCVRLRVLADQVWNELALGDDEACFRAMMGGVSRNG